MGNKNTVPASDGGITREQDASLINTATGGVSAEEAQSPSPELLASLQDLGENDNYTLLPHSLHQIAEAYSQKQDYQWAIQFLQLEKLYHERLLANLTALQEKWEGEFNDKDTESLKPANADNISQKHIEKLNYICRTHRSPPPSLPQKQKNLKALHEDTQIRREILQSYHERANTLETTQAAEEKNNTMISLSEFSSLQREEDEQEERRDKREEVLEEELDVEADELAVPGDDIPEEEEVKVEWPAGVAQALDKDLAKLSNSEESFTPDGLVSILKRKRASLDGLPPPSDIGDKQSSKRKVRFSEPEDGTEQDEVGGDSCLILLLLCLVTVVISIGGTALYCTLVDTYANICTDFTENVDFYVTNVRSFLEGFERWVPMWT